MEMKLFEPFYAYINPQNNNFKFYTAEKVVFDDLFGPSKFKKPTIHHV